MKSTLGFYGCVVVSSEGLSGGIGLFWTTEVLLNLIHFSKSHIDVTGRRKDGDTPAWRLTGFYGEPRREDRHITWHLIRSLREQSQLPWLCMGDFNEVLYGSEHFGVVERAEWQTRAFREDVEDCNLQDLGFNKVPLTWDNCQPSQSNVKARIDRALGDTCLRRLFPESRVKHISSTKSDHCFVVIELLKLDHGQVRHHTGSIFHYENMWQTHADYDKVVEDLWSKENSGGGLVGVASMLKTTQAGLKVWGAENCGNIQRRLARLRKDLERCRKKSLFSGSSHGEKKLIEKINELLFQEEIWIKQWSRVQWLRAGDRNTSFFHVCAAHRKRQNKITTLKRIDVQYVMTMRK